MLRNLFEIISTLRTWNSALLYSSLSILSFSILFLGPSFIKYQSHHQICEKIEENLIPSLHDALSSSQEALSTRLKKLSLPDGVELQVLNSKNEVIFDRYRPDRERMKFTSEFEAKFHPRDTKITTCFLPQDNDLWDAFWLETLPSGLNLVLALPKKNEESNSFQNITEFIVILFGVISILALLLHHRLFNRIGKWEENFRNSLRGQLDPDPSDSSDIEELKIRLKNLQLSQQNAVIQAQSSIPDLSFKKQLRPDASLVTPSFEVQTGFETRSELGGDWISIFERDGSVWMCMIDSAASGVRGAIITQTLRGAIDSLRFDTHPNLQISEVFSRLQSVLTHHSLKDEVATLWIGKWDSERAVLTYSSAGHTAPWLFEVKEEGDIHQNILTAKGTRLGDQQEFTLPETHEMSLTDRHILFVFSDGLFEISSKESIKHLFLTQLSTQRNISLLSSELKSFLSSHQLHQKLKDDWSFIIAKPKVRA